jgi:phage terminase small subunit
MKKLTPKQKAFCDFYLISLNATEAAIKAGYSKKTASVIGNENLNKPYIADYIQSRLAERENGRIASLDDVLEFLTESMHDEDSKRSDRIRAAELLGKRYAAFTDNSNQNVNLGVTIEDDL